MGFRLIHRHLCSICKSVIPISCQTLKKEIDMLHKETNLLVKKYVNEKIELESKASNNRLEYIIVLNQILKVKNLA